jgi:hypothetical protein
MRNLLAGNSVSGYPMAKPHIIVNSGGILSSSNDVRIPRH